ncbi:hypothetical protein BTH38_04660 [Bacillus toyonensis]|uniref:hypothetical protein n=1 Tax=Bacillus toyonensis TaxID=155322 RepID=UPI000A19D5C8|nr:hypothetical protein [Bacillus toyonensis]OSM14692.1 hypothetical protein BTH38_04660 [Bacillus toyonensis]
MKNILNALKVGTEMNMEITDLLSEHKRRMVTHQRELIEAIENGFITDEGKIKKSWQLIELVYEWSIDNPCNVEHMLDFYNGTIEISCSVQGGNSGKWIMDYKNDELYLDGEKFDGAIPNLLNFIEAEILIHHV